MNKILTEEEKEILDSINNSNGDNVSIIIKKVRSKLEKNNVTCEFSEARCLYNKYIIIEDGTIFRKGVFKNSKFKTIYKTLEDKYDLDMFVYDKKIFKIDFLREKGIFENIDNFCKLKEELEIFYPNYLILPQEVYDSLYFKEINE